MVEKRGECVNWKIELRNFPIAMILTFFISDFVKQHFDLIVIYHVIVTIRSKKIGEFIERKILGVKNEICGSLL